MAWQENKDNTIWVRWGASGENDDPETTYVVKAGDELIGRITEIRGSTTYEGKAIMSMELKGGKEVSFLVPTRLQSDLGLNPKWNMKITAEVGDTIKIVYRGKDKKAEGNPHTFDVFFDK